MKDLTGHTLHQPGAFTLMKLLSKLQQSNNWFHNATSMSLAVVYCRQ